MKRKILNSILFTLLATTCTANMISAAEAHIYPCPVAECDFIAFDFSETLEHYKTHRARRGVHNAHRGIHSNSANSAEPSNSYKVKKELEARGFDAVDKGGNGHCQFHSIGDRLGALGRVGPDGTPLTKNSYELLRQQAAEHISKNRHAYEGFTDDDLEDYATKMGFTQKNGDDLTLKALSRIYNVNIITIDQRNRISGNIRHRNWKNTIVLGHISESHYVAGVRVQSVDDALDKATIISLIDNVVETYGIDRVVTQN